MFRFAKSAINLTAGQRALQVRHGSTESNFHAKYGNGLIVGGTAFCIAVWSYVLTQTGITWNLSPVGKVQPQPWREAEAEEE